jgi:uncharacterized Zn finger protein (UPF0148 family)
MSETETAVAKFAESHYVSKGVARGSVCHAWHCNGCCPLFQADGLDWFCAVFKRAARFHSKARVRNVLREDTWGLRSSRLSAELVA